MSLMTPEQVDASSEFVTLALRAAAEAIETKFREIGFESDVLPMHVWGAMLGTLLGELQDVYGADQTIELLRRITANLKKGESGGTPPGGPPAN